MKTIITFGTYDLLHVGHIRLLSRAKELGDRLVVGVSSDSLNFSKKNKYPEFSQQERMEIISMIKEIGRAHVRTPVTSLSRMPSSA